MRLNRKSVSMGLAGLGLAGALVGGGITAAANATPSSVTTVTSATAVVGSGGPSGHMSDMMFGSSSAMTSAASYLGLSRADLEARMQQGMSLAGIAKARARTVSGLEAAMTAGLKASLLANTTLTTGQRATILADMGSNLHAMVTMTYSGDGMGMGMGTGNEMGTGMNAAMDTGTNTAMGSEMGSATGSAVGSGMNGMGS